MIKTVRQFLHLLSLVYVRKPNVIHSLIMITQSILFVKCFLKFFWIDTDFGFCRTRFMICILP